MQMQGKYGTLVTKDGKVICPSCGRPTQYRVRPDTEAKNWPIWCKNCRKENVVNICESLSQCRVDQRLSQ